MHAGPTIFPLQLSFWLTACTSLGCKQQRIWTISSDADCGADANGYGNQRSHLVLMMCKEPHPRASAERATAARFPTRHMHKSAFQVTIEASILQILCVAHEFRLACSRPRCCRREALVRQRCAARVSPMSYTPCKQEGTVAQIRAAINEGCFDQQQPLHDNQNRLQPTAATSGVGVLPKIKSGPASTIGSTLKVLCAATCTAMQ